MGLLLLMVLVSSLPSKGLELGAVQGVNLSLLESSSSYCEITYIIELVDLGIVMVVVGFFAFSFLGTKEVNKSEIELILLWTAVIVFYYFALGVTLSLIPKSIYNLSISSRNKKHSPSSMPS
jgi:uncharacterized membrane-anchored protein